jgi:hypothetical protein
MQDDLGRNHVDVDAQATDIPTNQVEVLPGPVHDLCK